ncbi:hypothetical protein GQ457_05G026440 [Hibiscus cannabinus]
MKAMEEILDFLGEFLGEKVTCMSKNIDPVGNIFAFASCFLPEKFPLKVHKQAFKKIDTLAREVMEKTIDENCNMERERVGSDVKFSSLKKLTRDHRVEMQRRLGILEEFFLFGIKNMFLAELKVSDQRFILVRGWWVQSETVAMIINVYAPCVTSIGDSPITFSRYIWIMRNYKIFIEKPESSKELLFNTKWRALVWVKASKEGLFEIVDDWWQNPSNCLIGSVKFNVEAGVQWMGVGPLAISQGIVVVAVGLSMVVVHVVLIMEEAMVMAGEVGAYDTENCAN